MSKEAKALEKQDYIIVSLSGGKDSTAMVLRMIELGEKIDEVIFCDTYKEFPAMYRHLDKVRAAVEKAGIKFTTLKNEKSFDYFMFDFRPEKEIPGGFFEERPELKGRSWATAKMRWCTKYMKIAVIREYLRSLKEQYNIVHCVGIAADETKRLERKGNQGKDKRFPLVEWGWTEADCLKYCYDNGFDWDGLYEIFDRASCWCCPLQSLKSLRSLRLHFPKLWNELKEMDTKTWRKFQVNCSVQDLEKRFEFEEERKKCNLPINNKSFYSELKQRLSA